MKNKPVLSKALRWSALVLLVGSLATWVFTGANRGWTRTSDTTKAVDEVTGLEYPVTTPAFRPGVELLAVALVGSLALGGAAWWTGRKAEPKAA